MRAIQSHRSTILRLILRSLFVRGRINFASPTPSILPANLPTAGVGQTSCSINDYHSIVDYIQRYFQRRVSFQSPPFVRSSLFIVRLTPRSLCAFYPPLNQPDEVSITRLRVQTRVNRLFKTDYSNRSLFRHVTRVSESARFLNPSLLSTACGEWLVVPKFRVTRLLSSEKCTY